MQNVIIPGHDCVVSRPCSVVYVYVCVCVCVGHGVDLLSVCRADEEDVYSAVHWYLTCRG